MPKPLAALRSRWAAWKPPEPNPDGTMALGDHLRELRYRVVVSAIAVVLVTIVAAFFYRPLVELVMWPYHEAIREYMAANPDAETLIVNSDAISPFMLALKASLVAGVILSCPVWLYQLWSFIVPALLDKEKKYARLFLASAIPLFLLGTAVGFAILPKGIAWMLQFTLDGVTNLQDVEEFLSLEIRFTLVSGVAFLLPVVLVLLNLAGVLKGEQMTKARPYALFGTAVFGAVATPSSDPFSMLALAVPMALMYVVAEVIARRHDRRKARNDDRISVEVGPL